MNKKNHSNEKVAHMIGQMASFKCFESYYSTKYSSSFVKPKIWWQMINDPSDYLKSVALKLYSITPHSASCERAFSMLNFLYGKKRQCLNISTIEMLSKIRYYLLSNVKNELNNLEKETELELKILIKECGFFNYENDDDDDDDDNDDENYDDFYYNNNIEIPTNEVYVLIVNDIIDLNNSVFNGEFQEEIHDNPNDSDNDEVSGEEELDFETIARISAPSDM
jgi:hypothetical protein